MSVRSLAAVGIAASMALLAACGSSNSTSNAAATTTTLGAVQRQAIPGAPPSASSKMICSTEGQGAIEGSLGEKPIKPVTPTWKNEVYACSYVYPNGTLNMTVHELPNDAAAMENFDQLKTQLKGHAAQTVLAQGTFQTPNDSIYVVKDNKVLDVDVSKLPANFGVPPLSRSDVALTVAVTIMGCWTGV